MKLTQNNKSHFYDTNLVIHHLFIVYNINQNHQQHNRREKQISQIHTPKTYEM